MITLEELNSLYENELKDKLASLESQRKSLLTRYIIAVVLILLPFALYLPTSSSNQTMSNIFPLFIIGVLGGIVLIFLTGRKKREYRTKYKNQVVTQVVHAIDSTWNYQADGHIPTTDYHQSDLFRQRYDRYNGDDLISGVIDKTDFKCSELHTEYVTHTTDSEGKRKEEWHTIFKGLFFHADFNKDFKARTYIAPDGAEKLLGKFAHNLQKLSNKGDLVKLENQEFEKMFKVHSTDQIEARYILTPTIMEALVNLRKQINRSMHLSFIGNRVFCAISFNKNLFEPRIMKSGVNFKDIQEMYHLFRLNAIIIQELNLNTRIWTKD